MARITAEVMDLGQTDNFYPNKKQKDSNSGGLLTKDNDADLFCIITALIHKVQESDKIKKLSGKDGQLTRFKKDNEEIKHLEAEIPGDSNNIVWNSAYKSSSPYL